MYFQLSYQNKTRCFYLFLQIAYTDVSLVNSLFFFKLGTLINIFIFQNPY